MNRNPAISFVKQIKEIGFDVPKLQISTLAELNFATAFDQEPTTIMANDVAAGVDYDPEMAVTKALVEYFERKVFVEGVESRNPLCARTHSDGIAAFPVSHSDAQLFARENAYAEALERFAWAKWWDERKTGFSVTPFDKTHFWLNQKTKSLLKKFDEMVPLATLKVIELFTNDKNRCVFILIAEVKGYGYISGGAAGQTNQQEKTVLRGFSELIRHGLALTKFIKLKRSPSTFYEERLLYFGLGHGNKLVQETLSHPCEEILDLPKLEIDGEIVSKKYNRIVVTHRCLFQDQPPFVDGKLERLCL